MKLAFDRPISLRGSIKRINFGWRSGRILACVAGLLALGLSLSASSASEEDDQKTADIPRAQVAVLPHEAGSRRIETDAPTASAADVAAVNRAKQMMADCRISYDAVKDYTCNFYKRERINGILSDMQVMTLKARTHPLSFYIRCVTPRKGREAIWIKGRNDGKVVAHDAGFVKVLAGTMRLDPKSGVAMEDNRHPITEAGLGNMIDSVRQHWETELKPGITRVEFHPHVKVGDRVCTMIETTHPNRDGTYVFQRVRLYIDDQLKLPIRIEGYDWPKRGGTEFELVEEYTYANLKINPGLSDKDFDPANPTYSYGRF